jgi:hypothetical protein
MRIQGGQVDTGETLAERLERLSIPQAATATPLGATRAGATPNQAKMARSPARLQSLTKQAVTPPEQTLQTAQRQAQGMGGVNVQDQSAQLQTTQALAGMSTMAQQRIQAAINERLNAVAQQQQGQAKTLDLQALQQALGVQGTGSKQVTLGEGQEPITQAEAVVQFQQKLKEYAQNPSQDKLVELETLRRAAGFQGDLTSTRGINDLFMQAGLATGVTAAEAVQNQLQVKDFTPTDLGFASFNDLAAALGVDPTTVENMSIEELQRQTQLAVAREQQHIKDLRAKLASSPPNSLQRMIYERRLNNVLAGGASQIELKAAEAAEDIAVADKIKIGDQQMSVADVLDDAQLSRRIEAYLYSSPEQRNRLFPPEQFAELREWIEANELALHDLAATLAEEQEGWRTSLDAWRNIGNLQRLGAAEGIDLTLPNNVISAITGNVYDPDKLVTQTQVDAVSNAIKNSPVGELMKDPANVAKIQALDPEDLAKLRDANNNWNSIETVNKQYEAGQAFKTNEQYKQFAGATNHTGDYATTDDLLKHTQAAPVFDKVSKEHPNWLDDKDFMNASLATKKLFADNPQRFKEFTELRALQKAVAGPVRNDANTLSKAMFGTDLASMEVMYYQLKRQSGFNRAAASQLEKFKKIFGGDGNPVTGFWNLASKLLGSLDKQNIDTAAKGEAAEVLAAINEIKNAKFHERPEPSSIHGGSRSIGQPSIDMSTLYDIAERVTGNQPMNMNHFIAMVDEVLRAQGFDPATASQQLIENAIAIVNDEFVYATKASATPEQIQRGEAPENFPAEYEEAKRKYDQYVLAPRRKQKEEEEAKRAAEQKAQAEAQARQIQLNTMTAELNELQDRAREAKTKADQMIQARNTQTNATNQLNLGPLNYGTILGQVGKKEILDALKAASDAQARVIQNIHVKFNTYPWLRDNKDWQQILQAAEIRRADIEKRIAELEQDKPKDNKYLPNFNTLFKKW